MLTWSVQNLGHGVKFMLKSDLRRSLLYSTVLNGTLVQTYDCLKCLKNPTLVVFFISGKCGLIAVDEKELIDPGLETVLIILKEMVTQGYNVTGKQNELVQEPESGFLHIKDRFKFVCKSHLGLC